MGIIKQGILGGFSGKVGSVVGTSWKGRAVMKAMPLSVANPRTAGQVAQRSKMTGCVEFAKSLLGTSILDLDNPFAGSISGYNRFVKRNISAFTSVGALIPASFKISEGALGVITGATIDASNGDSIVEITDVVRALSSYNLATDLLAIVVFNETQNEFGYLKQDGLDNPAEAYDVTMPSAVATGDILRVYLASVRVDKKYESDSFYKSKTIA